MGYMSVRYGLHPGGFYWWNHCLLLAFFWKNHQVSEGRRRLFRQENFELFSAGEIALKFSKFENYWFAHNSLSNGRRAVLIPFLDFQYFWTFWKFLLLKSLFFYHFFWKKYKVSGGRRQLFHQEIFQPFPRGKSLLNFFNLKTLNLLITP